MKLLKSVRGSAPGYIDTVMQFFMVLLFYIALNDVVENQIAAMIPEAGASATTVSFLLACWDGFPLVFAIGCVLRFITLATARESIQYG